MSRMHSLFSNYKSPCSVAATVAFAASVILLTSCTLARKNGDEIGEDANLRAQTLSVISESFETKGQATVERLNQDSTQRFCSTQRGLKNSTLSASSIHNTLQTQSISELMEKIRLENLAQIKPPADSNYFGDFKRGESIAQDGRGKTWTDRADSPSGGNCYNCHRLSKSELSYGTLGPSLYQYGKLRGITSIESFQEKLNSSSTDPIIQYTWGVLMNSKAFNLCTVMPRFGVSLNAQSKDHSAPILNEQQIKDLMSLLLDPRSAVND